MKIKISRIHLVYVLTLILGLILAACSREPTGNSASAAPQVEAPVAGDSSGEEATDKSFDGDQDEPFEAAQQGQASEAYWVEDQPQSDEQGAVTVEITPLNLNNAWESIDFQVAMNTHSVDLSMDLAALATLTTDTGHTVQASLWDAPSGGHHVSGTLSFPVSAETGPVLDGAKKITLTLVNVDAPERVFVWERGG
ncbi:MAG TPA: hypothetical protein VFZ76_03780 [Anaerolineales bacterium]